MIVHGEFGGMRADKPSDAIAHELLEGVANPGGEPVRCEIELIGRRSEIPFGALEWNEMVSGNDTNSIFQTYEWFDAWWSSFGHRYELFFLVVRIDGRPAGFAPLMVARNAVGLRQVQFIGTGNADYQDFVLPTEKQAALNAICAFLREQAARWDRVLLSNLPKQSRTVACLAEAVSGTRLLFHEEAQVLCPTLLIDGHESSVRQLFGKYSMRRPLNWFSRHGKVEFREVSPAEFETMMPRYFDQHVRRWRAKGIPSLFEDRLQRDFYQGLAARLETTGWLRFSVVELAGEPIAFHFGFDYGNTIIWYKPSFEIAFASRSPGLLLIRLMVEDAIERGRRELDFTIGDEQFKARFANAERLNLNIAVYHNRLLYAAGVIQKRARRTISTSIRVARRLLTKDSQVRDL